MLWRRRYFEYLIVFGTPVVISLVTPFAAVDAYTLSRSVDVTIGSVFVWLLVPPAVIGLALWYTMSRSATKFGPIYPYRYIKKVESISRLRWVAFGLAVFLWVIDLSPSLLTKFDLFSYDFIPFLVRLSVLCSLTLMLIALPLIVWYPDPLTFTRLGLLTELDVERHVPIVDNSFVHYNHLLRRKRWRLKIKDEFSLEAIILGENLDRKYIASSLIENLDESRPMAFIARLSVLTNVPIKDILSKSRLFTVHNVSEILGAVSAIYTFVLIVPALQNTISSLIH